MTPPSADLRSFEAVWRSARAPEGILERWTCSDGVKVAVGASVALMRVEEALHELVAPQAGRLHHLIGSTPWSSPEPSSRVSRHEVDLMQLTVIDILGRHHVMAVASICPDGWPQTTTVNYVAVGMTLYALISRSSDKYANLQKDDRVSIATGSEALTPAAIEGLSIRAKAIELRDEPQRGAMAERLARRNRVISRRPSSTGAAPH